MRIHRNLKLTALATAALIVLVGCSGGGSGAGAGGAKSDGAPFGDAVKGKELYTTSCVACHGGDAKGVAGLGKPLATPTEWMKKQSNEQLLEFMKTGRSAGDPENTTKIDMPPKGGNPALSEQDLKHIIAYIRSLQK